MEPVTSLLIARVRERAHLPEPAVGRLIRELSGETQQSIADVLGVSRVTVTRWEKGHRAPRGALRDAYARLLSDLAGALG